jgi:hypothetical protein
MPVIPSLICRQTAIMVLSTLLLSAGLFMVSGAYGTPPEHRDNLHVGCGAYIRTVAQ